MPRLPTTTGDQPSRIQPAAGGDAIALQCPECTQSIAVAPEDLVEGATVHCGHCSAEPALTHEHDDFTGKSRWILVDPLADYDEDFG